MDREGLMLVWTGRGSCYSVWASFSIAQAHSAEVSSSVGTTASLKVVWSLYFSTILQSGIEHA